MKTDSLIGSLMAMVIIIACSFSGPAQSKNDVGQDNIQQYLGQLKGNETWQMVDSVSLSFTTHHTQGLTKAGNYYFLSSVKVNRWPKKYPAPVNGFDRDHGDGIGYLFKFNADGALVDSIRLGKDEVYHPGGIDFDGKFIWVPVCEYRPFGKSIVYRVNPETMESLEVATIPDAIGAVSYNRQANELIGMNWGSRRFYKWKVNAVKEKPIVKLLDKKSTINPHFYVDYQDCNYAGAGKMICSGLKAYKNHKGETIRLGGLDLIDMNNYHAALQLPVNEFTSNGTVLTNNPFYIDVVAGKLRYYFIPEDDRSSLYIYQLQEKE